MAMPCIFFMSRTKVGTGKGTKSIPPKADPSVAENGLKQMFI